MLSRRTASPDLQTSHHCSQFPQLHSMSTWPLAHCYLPDHPSCPLSCRDLGLSLSFCSRLPLRTSCLSFLDKTHFVSPPLCHVSLSLSTFFPKCLSLFSSGEESGRCFTYSYIMPMNIQLTSESTVNVLSE